VAKHQGEAWEDAGSMVDIDQAWRDIGETGAWCARTRVRPTRGQRVWVGADGGRSPGPGPDV